MVKSNFKRALLKAFSGLPHVYGLCFVEFDFYGQVKLQTSTSESIFWFGSCYGVCYVEFDFYGQVKLQTSTNGRVFSSFSLNFFHCTTAIASNRIYDAITLLMLSYFLFKRGL